MCRKSKKKRESHPSRGKHALGHRTNHREKKRGLKSSDKNKEGKIAQGKREEKVAYILTI